MMFVRLLPVIFSCLLMSAHFSRANMNGIAIIWLLLPLLLLVKRHWVAKLFQILLIFAMFIWIGATFHFVQLRQAMGQPWVRLVIILSIVALFTGLSALVFENKYVKERFKK
ncbi:hypothetical protein B6D60_06785 [candidate division KSB1 bacterium 4484_87]|nr:MAG: hypothetical protein B6D60_06785 [candidate division KSB1 bacterium 4484_87]